MNADEFMFVYRLTLDTLEDTFKEVFGMRDKVILRRVLMERAAIPDDASFNLPLIRRQVIEGMAEYGYRPTIIHSRDFVGAYQKVDGD